MKAFSFFKLWLNKPSQQTKAYEHTDQLKVNHKDKTLYLKKKKYTFAQLNSTDYYSHLHLFFLEAQPQDISWLLNQSEIKGLEVGNSLRKNPEFYHEVLEKFIWGDNFVEDLFSNIVTIIQWWGAQKVFSQETKTNPLLKLSNITSLGARKRFIFLLDRFSTAMDLTQPFDGELLLTTVMRQSCCKAALSAIDSDKWNFRVTRLEDCNSVRHSIVKTSNIPLEDMNREEKKTFIKSQLHDLRNIDEEQAKKFLQALDCTGQDYLKPYIEQPSRLVEMFLHNPDYHMLKEAFSRYASQVEGTKLAWVYEQLCQSKVGFFYEEVLGKTYTYHALDKGLETKEPCARRKKL